MAYERHNFVVGQIFTNVHANEIEQGIIDNEEQIQLLDNAVDQLESEVNDIIDSGVMGLRVVNGLLCVVYGA